MLAFHILISLVILGTITGLWWQHRQRFLLLDALVGLLLFELVQIIFAYWNLLATEWPLIGLRLIAWGVLLAAATQAWRVVGLALVTLLLIAALPFVPAANFLMWGYLTAVPLLALLTTTPQQHTHLPIIAPTAKASSLRPISITGAITTDMLESQKPILDCLVEGIIFSGQTGLIDYANQAAALMLDMSNEEMLGHPVTDILAHLPLLGGSAAVNHFDINGRILQGQMSIIYNGEGIAQGTVAILRDITIQRHAEAARDDFLTTVSHELRTPLTAIKGYVELLASGAGGEISASQKSFLNTIQRNVNRMVQLINSLIFATTIRSGRLEYGSGPTDLARLIDQLAREIQPKAAQAGQQITTDLDENLIPIQADPMHMETIISELLQNAMKYNQQGGKIHVSALLEGNGVPSQTFAVVSIRDDGVGVAAEDWDRIFDEFYRPDKSTSQVRAGGMGMGLSIVRALVEAYNGRIWFDSIPNQGSTFTFIIPIHQPAEMIIP